MAMLESESLLLRPTENEITPVVQSTTTVAKAYNCMCYIGLYLVV